VEAYFYAERRNTRARSRRTEVSDSPQTSATSFNNGANALFVHGTIRYFSETHRPGSSAGLVVLEKELD